MTGFGLGEAESAGLVIRVEMRSVNHRFLQTRFRLPSEFADLEPRVEQAVKKKLARGAVTMTVIVTRSAAPTSVSVDEKVAARYKKLLDKTAASLKVENDIKLSNLIALPGVISSKLDDKAHAREAKLLLSAVDKAITNLVSMRDTEGAAMEADIQKQAKAIAKLQGSVEKLMPKVVKTHFEAMLKRAGDLLENQRELDGRDMARELALIAERSDVAEEISRLDSHLQQLQTILAKGGEVGRKLDFLVQELYREANTIGSKAGDAKVAHQVVDLKTHIERIREQVQNIE
ncbi:MAG: hypothetical protein ACI8X5_000964 [Planctomycetota bacterium]|jgi:uncharacterized protein (TIGR00255 family)